MSTQKSLLMLSSDNKKRLLDESEKYFSLATDFFNHPFIRPNYLFNQRGRIAGSAHLQRNMIKFNVVLFLNNQQEFIENVVPHEVAHLIAFQLYGRVKPHGKEWQTIMETVFNVEASTTHSFDVDDVTGKKFHYRCDCREHELTVRRHNKILKGARYLCKNCRGALNYQQTS